MKGDCNICVNGKLPFDSATCVECGLSRKNYKPITNADKIRAMTDEELAGWMANNVDCQYCSVRSEWCTESEAACKRNWLDWLRQEVKE